MTLHQTNQIDQALPVEGASDFATSAIHPLDVSRILIGVRMALESDPIGARASVERLARLLQTTIDARGRCHLQGGLAPWQRRKIEAYIEERLGATITVKALADLISLSSSQLGRAFKQTFGTSPHAHIVRRRVERAQQLMLASNEPIGQIALASGFADQAHLSNMFRRLVGETPNGWRRANVTRP